MGFVISRVSTWTLRLGTVAATAALLAGCSMGSMFGSAGPAPASSAQTANPTAQELSAAATAALPAIATECPPIKVRRGGEALFYYGKGKVGDAHALNYQAVLDKQSRNCVACRQRPGPRRLPATRWLRCPACSAWCAAPDGAAAAGHCSALCCVLWPVLLATPLRVNAPHNARSTGGIEMRRRLLVWAVPGAALWLSGCAFVHKASEAEDAQAKAFTTRPGKGALYIYRSELLGAALGLEVVVNGVSVGDTSGQSFFRLDLNPGQYTIESRGDNTASLTVTVQAGRATYVWQEFTVGIVRGRTELHLVDEGTGRAGVQKSGLLTPSAAAASIAPAGAAGRSAPAATTAPPSPAPAAAPSATGNTAQRLRELQQQRRQGRLSEREYQRRRAELLK